MLDSDQSRLTVSLVDVRDGHEAEFLKWVERLAALMESKGYGRTDIVRDEADSRRFYAVRHWASRAAAERCHGDRDAQVLASRLSEIARVTHIVNGVRPADERRVLDAGGRAGAESDRRMGFERRTQVLGSMNGERRSGTDRRIGPRRLRGQAGDVGLVGAARRARENADTAFSHFKVGAALEAADGTVITGCNIENATYGLTICAERVAMFKALSEGHRAFTRIAIVADTPVPAPPCGACRQILWEFGGNIEVLLADLKETRGTHQLKDLLPLPFDARLL